MIVISVLLWFLVSRRNVAVLLKDMPEKRISREDCIVSLTTIPDRTRKLHSTLVSLLDQTVPLEIQIHIPLEANCEPGRKYEFTEEILDHPLIKVIQHPIDQGPSMKFIPAIESEDRHIIVVDDDVVYPRTLNERLLERVDLDRDDRVYCTRGNVFVGGKKFKNLHSVFSDEVDEIMPVAFITGCGGYILPRKVVNQLKGYISDYSDAPKEAKLMDDIWISGILNRLDIERFVIPNVPRFQLSIPAFFSLAHLNSNREENNDKVIEHLF